MKVQFELVIGQNKFTLIEEVESNAEFFKKLHFYSTLPQVGPNGETDLVLTYRVAQKQYEYYSIVSQKAQQEFRFGQQKDGKGALFAKGWEPLYKAEREDEEQTSASTSGGLGTPVATTSAPVARQAQNVGLGGPAPAPQAAAPTPAAPPPARTQPANDILAKFGIQG